MEKHPPRCKVLVPVLRRIAVSPLARNRSHIVGRILGPRTFFFTRGEAKKRDHFLQLGRFFSPSQAAACWRWLNFLHHQAGQKPVVNVNLDETAIKLMPNRRIGFMVARARHVRRSPQSLSSTATKTQLRGTFTHVCLVCDNAALQPHLPQFLIMSEALFTKTEMQGFRQNLPSNIVLLHRPSSWMKANIFQVVLQMLKTVVQEHLGDWQIVFTADCYKAHITQNVWKTCTDLDIFYAVIPAKLTWAIQPCDTHVFAKLKKMLQDKCMQAMLRSQSGSLSKDMLVTALISTVVELLNPGDWKKAFNDNGLCGPGSLISQRVLQKLNYDAPPNVGHDLPTLQQLQSVWPKNAIIPVQNVFGCFLPKRPSSRGQPVVEREHRAITRSMSAAASQAIVVGASSSSAACPPPLPPPAMAPPPLVPPALRPSSAPLLLRRLPSRPQQHTEQPPVKLPRTDSRH